MGLDPERGDPDLEGLPCNDDLLAEAEQLGEPHELRQARARLAAFTAPTLAGGDACEGLPGGGRCSSGARRGRRQAGARPAGHMWQPP